MAWPPWRRVRGGRVARRGRAAEAELRGDAVPDRILEARGGSLVWQGVGRAREVDVRIKRKEERLGRRVAVADELGDPPFVDAVFLGSEGASVRGLY
jgi:hypothetical protein